MLNKWVDAQTDSERVGNRLDGERDRRMLDRKVGGEVKSCAESQWMNGQVNERVSGWTEGREGRRISDRRTPDS